MKRNARKFEVDKQLALACLVKEDAFDRRHLVDYNITLFKETWLRDDCIADCANRPVSCTQFGLSVSAERILRSTIVGEMDHVGILKVISQSVLTLDV